MIVTEMAVIDVRSEGLFLREIGADTTIEAVKVATEADLIVPQEVGRFA